MAAADLHSAVLETFAGLEADERLAGQGLAEAFAEAFPAVPAASSVPSLTMCARHVTLPETSRRATAG